MQSITVTPEMWYCDSLSIDGLGKKDSGGLADVDLLRKAGFTAACKRLTSPSLATLNRCRGQYLELTDDVSRVFFSNTSCGTSYASCWAPIDKSVPRGGAIPRSVAESVVKARASGLFRGFMVASYQRTIGRDNEGHKEWAVVGYLSDEGNEHRFLIAYWAKQGVTPPSLGVIRALAQEEQDRKSLKDERDCLEESLESALEANRRRRQYGVYRLRWFGVFGLVALAGALSFAPPWISWMSGAMIVGMVATGFMSFLLYMDDFVGLGLFGLWRRAVLTDDEYHDRRRVLRIGVPRKTIRGYRQRIAEINRQIDRF
jgi:hypothetical protein